MINPFHTLQRWMEENARRAEAARQAEAAKRATEATRARPSQPSSRSRFEQLLDYFSGKPGARRP